MSKLTPSAKILAKKPSPPRSRTVTPGVKYSGDKAVGGYVTSRTERHSDGGFRTTETFSEGYPSRKK